MNESEKNLQFSRRIADLHASPIREILSVIDKPGMISFAGGLPSTESFPEVDLDSMPRQWLQYGTTEGELPLRERVAEDLGKIGLECSPEQILILSGSQQGIDLVAKLFIDPGTRVGVESPTYLAALQVFRYFGARFATIDPLVARAGLSEIEAPAFVYAIPTFQNPTGRCYSTAERENLARGCNERGIPLFEDDPYRDLVYDDCDRTPACSHMTQASWIYQSSFSKSLAPGLRLGFMASSPDLVVYLNRLKQAADLHSSRLSQWIVLEQLRSPGRYDRLKVVVAAYRRKRDNFAKALSRHFGGLATWQVPPGGLFFWINLNARVDTRALLAEAIPRGVAFMPGEPFFPDNRERAGVLRLNFSHANEEQTERGLAILAELVKRAALSEAPVMASA
jgi:DNA-binding transcriptional MocR family regulator